MSVYVVNGAPGSGKTTFESTVKKLVGARCLIMSTIDFVKKAALACGWDGKKTLEGRAFLSDLKRFLTEHGDTPYKVIKKAILGQARDFEYYGFDNYAIFVDCREPEEIERLCKDFNAKSILISRKEAENKETSNRSDSEVLNYNYDIIIDNNGDLAALADKAIEFIQKENLPFYTKELVVDFFGEIHS